MKRKIVLASASPRREELLRQIGLEFEVDPSDSEEEMVSKLEPHELARSLAHEKASKVASKHPDALIIAADTFIVFGDRLMGKAQTDSEAREMLNCLSGNSHSVITGFALMDTNSGRTFTDSVETKVLFRTLSSAEIDSYIDSKEPAGKAGAYAVQGLGAVLVEGIVGDYFNVVGLPLAALSEALKEFGVYIL
ncbi:MAG: Maf family protein [Dehalococcoidia bacterium]